MTEVEDLFGHEPLGARTRSLFEAYAREARDASRYDFHMGGRLRKCLESAGFRVSAELELADQELAFEGPASPDVLAAWQGRLERMRLLKVFCGAEFEAVKEEFLACLVSPDHRSQARVFCCIATA